MLSRQARRRSRRRNRGCAGDRGDRGRRRASPAPSMSASAVRPHCSAASTMCARIRSRLSLSTMVRCVITGSSRATPSSTAFSTSQSTRPFLTGAKASHRSGTRFLRPGRFDDGQRHPLPAGFSDLGQPFARRTVEQQQPVALLQAHDIAEIIGLRRIQLDPGARAKRQSRRTVAAGFAAARREWQALPHLRHSLESGYPASGRHDERR